MPARNRPFDPKDPAGPLRVLIVGRISTVHQNLENIDASYRFVEDHLKRLYVGPIHYKHLGEQASGMRTDRVTILEAEDEVDTGSWDLVIAEDLSRFFRNPRHQYAFVQDAIDRETRVICIGDNLDTAEDGWEVALGAATLRHGLHIPDTSRRVKRTAIHSFHKGGMVQKVRYGYRKLTGPEAASREHGPEGLRIARVPECTPVIREMARGVLEGHAYTAIAAGLNDRGVAPGGYSTHGVWTGRLVADLLRDPILHGTRTFGDVLSRTVYSTGRHKRRKNTEAPENEHYPDLAHLSEDEHRELLEVMDRRAKSSRSAAGRAHPLYDRPRSRSIWPGQHPRCAACGGLMYRYDNDQLKCEGSFRAQARGPCWNHVQVSCEEVRDRVLDAVLGRCAQVPGFRDALVTSAWTEMQSRLRRRGRDHLAIDQEVADLEKRAEYLGRAIGDGGRLETLLAQLTEAEFALGAARRKKADRDRTAGEAASPSSRTEVEARLGEVLRDLGRTSFDFADLMRKIIPEFAIRPVQALDTGLVRPRAEITLRLAALIGGPPDDLACPPHGGDVPLEIDLFEPPAHIHAIPACLDAKRADPGLSLEKLAVRTENRRMTVKRALDYARLMEAEGIGEPYRVLRERPQSASRWKYRDIP